MIFTEIRFFLFVAGCWLTFFAVPVSRRTLMLAIWGVVFYASYAGPFLPLVLALTFATYVARGRAGAMAAGTVIVLCLIWFKLDPSARTFLPAGLSPGAMLIPLGLSFLAFELLHVMIERRRGRIGAVPLVDLLAFAFFFPARVAGPIKRYPDFLASVADARPSSEHVYAGALRVLLGLAKKVLLADVLALTLVEKDYAESAMHAWTIVMAYALQIFLDFSAYSDMAIGVARMLGIRLPENFHYPYFAPNIREFWNRWHITLSHWVRDYVFMPAGRRLFQTPLRSSPAVIAAVSYLVTFIVVGAWHGLTWPFLIWGAYHGVLLSGHHVIRARMPRRIAAHPLYQSSAVSAAGGILTFVLVAIGWVPFMSDLDTAGRLLGLMFGAGR